MITAVGDLVRSRELFLALIERHLRLRAKRALIGTVWPAVAPLVMLALYTFVFGRVFNVPIQRYPEFLFAGLLPWAFMAQTISLSVTSLSSEADLIRRAPFRHELLPIAATTAMGVYFLVTLLGFVVWLGAHGRLHWQLLGVLAFPLVALFLFTASLAMLAALFDVYNRDLRWVLGNLLTVWFFMVPIVYRQEMAPESVHFLRAVDPMNMIVGQFRGVLIHGRLARPEHVVLMLVVCAGLFLVCLNAFRRLSRQLPKDV